MFGVYRATKDGRHIYVSRTATHSEKLAREIAEDLSRGQITLPTGETRLVKPFPHVALRISGEDAGG